MLTTIAVAIFTYRVGREQASTAKSKLRLDLFDKRYKILDATRTVFGVAIAHGQVEVKALNAFSLATLDAEFLFGKDMADYIKEVRRQLALLSMYHEMLAGPDRSGAVEGKGKVMMWFSQQIDGLHEKFQPFMKLDG